MGTLLDRGGALSRGAQRHTLRGERLHHRFVELRVKQIVDQAVFFNRRGHSAAGWMLPR